MPVLVVVAARDTDADFGDWIDWRATFAVVALRDTVAAGAVTARAFGAVTVAARVVADRDTVDGATVALRVDTSRAGVAVRVTAVVVLSTVFGAGAERVGAVFPVWRFIVLLSRTAAPAKLMQTKQPKARNRNFFILSVRLAKIRNSEQVKYQQFCI